MGDGGGLIFGQAFAALLLLAACGTGQSSDPAANSSGDETDTQTAPVTAEPEASLWLGRLQEEGMLTYQVEGADPSAPVEVRMLVQLRVSRAGNIAVRLVPIGTPLGEEPIYPQWLVGTSEGLSALVEGASFTTPGFVPIDERGRLRTEAAANEVWRIETRWLRAGATVAGGETAVGWTLRERVGTIDEPIAADECVRLERSDGAMSSAILICAGIGVVERTKRTSDEVRSRWRLIAIGERPAELE